MGNLCWVCKHQVNKMQNESPELMVHKKTQIVHNGLTIVPGFLQI